jgi:hypothetical protein
MLDTTVNLFREEVLPRSPMRRIKQQSFHAATFQSHAGGTHQSEGGISAE